jgi:hypothetical protein
MSGNRKAFEAEVIKWVAKIAGEDNKKLYEDLFSGMDDKEFDQFVLDLETGKKKLAVISPNFSKNKISVEKNLKVAKELGYDFFKRVWIPAKNGVPAYLTPMKYMVVTLPIRRQAQLLDKKISIPEDNNSVDNMTGQPTGKSKGSKVSYPEVQVLAAMNMEHSLHELMKFRGGDAKGFNAMNTIISRTGEVSQKHIEPYSGVVKSTHSLKVMLTGMHLKNTLPSQSDV